MLAVQCRMARVALDLGVRELAKMANVAVSTVARFERGEELKDTTISAIRTALEAAGVIFLADGDITNGGPGVRLKERSR